MSGRFIKNDELGARCESARQGQALALPNGQADTAGPDNGIPPVGGGGQDGVKAGSCCCSIKVLEGQAAHVVQDRPRHEGGGLGNPSDLITPGGGIDVCQCDLLTVGGRGRLVQEDATRIRGHISQQTRNDGRLSGTRRAGQSRHDSGGDDARGRGGGPGAACAHADTVQHDRRR